MVNSTKCRYDITLQPVSGKALPLHAGEVMRITQVAGEQCVDFNCFNLHDYKERMSVGHMRLQGFRIKQGHIVVSTPPRYRPMLAVTHMAESHVTDLLGARCDATMGEREYGLVPRTNCQDTFAEAVREYRLTPDDVHDSFNMWMHTVWGQSFRVLRNIGPKGDYVDLLALMDVLAVPIICGSGDLGQVSNFSFKPIRVQIFEATSESRATMEKYLERCSGFVNQRKREDMRVNKILTQRELRPVKGYQPRFRRFPLELRDIAVSLTRAQLQSLRKLRGKAGARATDEDVVRSAFMLWYLANRMNPHWVHPDGPGCC